MKILSIAKTIILRSVRDINTMLIMCAMPLAIIFVLGLAFDSQVGGDGNITLEEMHITYTVIGERTELSNGIETMMDEVLEEGSTYTQVEDIDIQLEKLKSMSITAYIEIDEESSTVKLYKNNRVNTSSSILESALRSFAARYNTIVEIAKVNPMALQTVLSSDENNEYIEKIGLQEKYQPSAMDYYGVAMVALFILYNFLTPLEMVMMDRKEGMTTRISTTAVRPIQVFLGKVLGFVAVGCINTTIVIVVSKLLFGVNWGENPIYPFMLLFAMIVMMTSLGMLLGEIFKSSSAASAVGHLFIVISAFFGGAYLALEDMGSIANFGKYFSVIWWANTGIMNQIYNNEYTSMITAVIIYGLLSALFLGTGLVFMNRKEAYSNG